MRIKLTIFEEITELSAGHFYFSCAYIPNFIVNLQQNT